MSFPPYPKYKPSGVEWLGDVPEHWKLNRIGKHFVERKERVSDRDFPALSVTKSGIVPQLETAAKTDDGDNRKKVLVGDFVINSRSDRKGSAGVAPLDGSVSLICTILVAAPTLATTYVHHLFRSVPFQEEFYRNGKGIVADLWSTNYSEMKNIRMPVPPLEEQVAIAEFLDRETGKIDELVAEQRRLIELLKEKRQAVISHAVTRGLNPDAPLKPSGIQWLGNIPEHWKVLALKRIVRLKSGDGITADAIQEVGEYPVFGGNGLRGYTSDFTHDGYFVVIGRQGALCGNINYAHGKFWASEHAVVASPLLEFNTFWLGEMLRAMNLNQHSVSAAQPGLSMEFVGNLRTAFPPLDEQTAIAAFLDQQIAKFDALTGEAERAIELLQERRTALISAAVTGKIDVRDSSG